MNKPVVYYNPKLPKLSINEQHVLSLLVEAAEQVALVYEQQENHKLIGGNFYPKDATKEEIEKAAKNDPAILSPYTVVERIKGKLVATPYYIKYADLLVPVAETLQQAAKATENREFAKRLKKQAEALLNGNYEEANIYWMKMKPYILGITIGPLERYDDKLFFIKTSYQAWVGVMDEEETARVTEFKNIILSQRRKTLMPSEKVSFLDKVQTRVDYTLIFSGLIARFKFTGTNLPNEIHLMEEYGSEITIFKPSLDERFEAQFRPAFKNIFESKFQKLYSEESLRKSSLYNILLHELGHSLIRYRDAENRLGSLFPVFDEIGASVMGIKVCGYLLVQDIISQKELESIMVMFLIRLFNFLESLKDDPSVVHYVIGNAIAFNFLVSSGALLQKGGISWPNFSKMFVALNELSTMLERILSQGTKEDAEEFIKRYGDYKQLQKFQQSH